MATPVVRLSAVPSPSTPLARSGCVYVNNDDYVKLGGTPTSFLYAEVKGIVCVVRAAPEIAVGTIAFNAIQRRNMSISAGDLLEVRQFVPSPNSSLFRVDLEVDFPNKGAQRSDPVDAQKLAEHMRRVFNKFPMTVGQSMLIEYTGLDISATVMSLTVYKLSDLVEGVQVKEQDIAVAEFGIVCQASNLVVNKKKDSVMKLVNAQKTTGVTTNIFVPEFWEQMGIGGLRLELGDVFRRAFASRVFPAEIMRKMNLKHVRGLLLYGPPGCGKTLLARQIGKMLSTIEPKVVNGPEILNKYVGQSEQNVRDLFADAERDQKDNGDDSDLHIIIFDELDAICRQRGARNDGTGVGDSVVNQLLSKIDGVEALNNVLVIGMTNRKDLLDEALLRPGRFEVHIEIGLPNRDGRYEIIQIHTKSMREGGILESDVDLGEIADMTPNFTGAEIEGLVKSASSFAMERIIDVAPDKVSGVRITDLKVTRSDFHRALGEIHPAIGVATDSFAPCLRGGMIDYGDFHRHLLTTVRLFAQQVSQSDKTPIHSCLLAGLPGCGKTALAATVAISAEFPFTKLISPEDLVGYGEATKCSRILKVFDDAYKSSLSIIVLDNIERLLEYVPIGPRFSNTILQLLLVLVKKAPPAGRRLLVIGTTSNASVLESMELLQAFNAVINVSYLDKDGVLNVLKHLKCFEENDYSRVVDSIDERGIGIKQLLLVIEMARTGTPQEGRIPFMTFLECLKTCGF